MLFTHTGHRYIVQFTPVLRLCSTLDASSQKYQFKQQIEALKYSDKQLFEWDVWGWLSRALKPSTMHQKASPFRCHFLFLLIAFDATRFVATRRTLTGLIEKAIQPAR